MLPTVNPGYPETPEGKERDLHEFFKECVDGETPFLLIHWDKDGQSDALANVPRTIWAPLVAIILDSTPTSQLAIPIKVEGGHDGPTD